MCSRGTPRSSIVSFSFSNTAQALYCITILSGWLPNFSTISAFLARGWNRFSMSRLRPTVIRASLSTSSSSRSISIRNPDSGSLLGSVCRSAARIFSFREKSSYFDQAWPVIRCLVVDPSGVGRVLTQECIKRARRYRSPVIALHTSAVMTVALPMYLRMGFEWSHDAPAVYGVRRMLSISRSYRFE
jgi:hypothetical protein